MLARDEGGAVSVVFRFVCSGRLMPRDSPPIEETNFDNPVQRQMYTQTGRMIGREALITAVAISMCAHVNAGSSEPVPDFSFVHLFASGVLTRNIRWVDLEQKDQTIDTDEDNAVIVNIVD